jgi:hypothetical protein
VSTIMRLVFNLKAVRQNFITKRLTNSSLGVKVKLKLPACKCYRIFKFSHSD